MIVLIINNGYNLYRYISSAFFSSHPLLSSSMNSSTRASNIVNLLIELAFMAWAINVFKEVNSLYDNREQKTKTY